MQAQAVVPVVQASSLGQDAVENSPSPKQNAGVDFTLARRNSDGTINIWVNTGEDNVEGESGSSKPAVKVEEENPTKEVVAYPHSETKPSFEDNTKTVAFNASSAVPSTQQQPKIDVQDAGYVSPRAATVLDPRDDEIAQDVDQDADSDDDIAINEESVQSYRRRIRKQARKHSARRR